LAHMDSERILIITHSYTPFINPRAFRWSAIAENWVQKGIKVDVITSWLPGLLRCEELNGVEVYRVGGGIIERLRALLRPKSRATTSTNETIDSAKKTNRSFKSLFLASVRFMHDKIWKNLYWPDFACTWIGPATNKALELCSMEDYSTVISVSDPFSSHLVGRKIRSQYPQLNWLVDIGDPFAFRTDNPTNNHKLYNKLNYNYESNVFAEADFISVTNENIKNKYSQLYAGSSRKTVVIPPMMNELTYSISDDRVLGESNRIKLVYIGTLYRKIRNPEYLLKLFSAVLSIELGNSVELHLIGGYHDCMDIIEPFMRESGDRLILHGLVNRQTVINSIVEADVLINIGNNNPYQLPSKLVEYAWFAKPIVNIHSLENDSSKIFLQDYPAILNLYTGTNESIEAAAQQLLRFVSKIPYEIDPKYLYDWQSKYGADRVSSKYYDLVTSEEILGRAKV
jgi:glycosyltransferase involved in cell wall biosynthesis